jgi:uncharacterized membrane protein YgaE (UPF0421/DUF939 family)
MFILGFIIGLLVSLLIIILELYLNYHKKGLLQIIENRVKPKAFVVEKDNREKLFENLKRNLGTDDYEV